GAMHRFASKRLLAMAPEVPLEEAVIGRRKTGFGTPVAAWLASSRGTAVHERAGLGLARQVAEGCYRP
nr:hypothetical protein [Lysobacter sp.]